jgi:hypothetical protein
MSQWAVFRRQQCSNCWFAAMDPWKEYAAWQDGRDVVRDWAALEGKSATMSEDLLRGYSPRSGRRLFFGAVSFIAHVGVAFAEFWRMFRSG